MQNATLTMQIYVTYSVTASTFKLPGTSWIIDKGREGLRIGNGSGACDYFTLFYTEASKTIRFSPLFC